jgi:GT2 family glycosyltransferase
MNHQPRVSIIVVGYQSRHHLARCLHSVLGQHYSGETEILFVDNASTDGSADYVRSTFPTVITLAVEANLGYAGGNNLGADRATGEVLVFLNPDTEVSSNWLAELVHPLTNDPTIGLTTSKILLLEDRTTINACGNEISLCGITWCRGAGQPAGSFSDDSDVTAVSGCAFAITASLFWHLGGFDESFFMYLEDTDLSWRARVAGYRCRFVASSVVYHDYRLKFSPAKIANMERNRYRMLAKHLSLRAAIALAPALLLGEVLAWGYATARGPAYLAAKARATGWFLVSLPSNFRSTGGAMEAKILREHVASPAVVGGVGGSIGRLVQVVIAALFKGATAAASALLPADSTPPLPLSDVPVEHLDRLNLTSNGFSDKEAGEDLLPSHVAKGSG